MNAAGLRVSEKDLLSALRQATRAGARPVEQAALTALGADSAASERVWAEVGPWANGIYVPTSDAIPSLEPWTHISR